MLKLILSSPINILFCVVIALTYFFVIFHYAGKNKKIVNQIELLFFGVFVTTIAGATGASLMPLPKLHPGVLALIGTTLPTIIGQLAFYGIACSILISRLRYTLKDFINVLAVLSYQAPFFCWLLLMSTFSFLWSNIPLISLRGCLTILLTSVLAIYFAKQYTWKEIYRFWRWISIIIVILSIAVAIQENQQPSWFGILGHKNQFSFLMAQTAVLWLMHAFYSPKQRRLSLVFVVLSVFGLIKGESGASKVLIVALLSLWGYFGFVKKLKVQWAVVSVILFMILSVFLTIIITENLKFIVVDTLNKDLTLTGRTEFWPLIVDKINERPILGYGVSGFWQAWRGADDPSSDIIVVKTQFRPGHAHNGFLDLALGLGWLGLGLFACSFFNNIAKAVIYLSRTPLPEAGIPLLLLNYTLLTNFTETGLMGVTGIWFWYVVTTVRLTLDTSGKSYAKQINY